MGKMKKHFVGLIGGHRGCKKLEIILGSEPLTYGAKILAIVMIICQLFVPWISKVTKFALRLLPKPWNGLEMVTWLERC